MKCNSITELKTKKERWRSTYWWVVCYLHTRLQGDIVADCVAIMPTAAVLGAAVGVGGALFLTLTLLIYRYHAAQKKEAADQHYPYHQGAKAAKGVGYNSLSNSWSTRDSWAPPPPYKTTSNCNVIDESHGSYNGRRRPLAKLYLPLTSHHQVCDILHRFFFHGILASNSSLSIYIFQLCRFFFLLHRENLLLFPPLDVSLVNFCGGIPFLKKKPLVKSLLDRDWRPCRYRVITLKTHFQ